MSKTVGTLPRTTRLSLHLAFIFLHPVLTARESERQNERWNELRKGRAKEKHPGVFLQIFFLLVGHAD